MSDPNCFWDEIEIGNIPHKEKGVSIDDPEYIKKAKNEAKEFRKQLMRHFGKCNDTEFLIKRIKQPYGTFFNVILIYNVSNWDSLNFAFKVEDQIPNYWDDISKKALEVTT